MEGINATILPMDLPDGGNTSKKLAPLLKLPTWLVNPAVL
jgi:hypothetical protein